MRSPIIAEPAAVVHFDTDGECSLVAGSRGWFKVNGTAPMCLKRGEGIVLKGPNVSYSGKIAEVEQSGGFLLVDVRSGVFRFQDDSLPTVRSSAAYPFARR